MGWEKPKGVESPHLDQLSATSCAPYIPKAVTGKSKHKGEEHRSNHHKIFEKKTNPKKLQTLQTKSHFNKMGYNGKCSKGEGEV